jgi:hypothetical protein
VCVLTGVAHGVTSVASQNQYRRVPRRCTQEVLGSSNAVLS